MTMRLCELVASSTITHKALCFLITIDWDMHAITYKRVFAAAWFMLVIGKMWWIIRCLLELIITCICILSVSHQDLIRGEKELFTTLHHQGRVLFVWWMAHVFMATHRLDYLLVQRKNLLAFALILSSLILDIVTHFQRRIQIHQCLTIIVHGHTWGHFCLIDFLWGNWVERFNWFFVSLVLWISIERAL